MKFLVVFGDRLMVIAAVRSVCLKSHDFENKYGHKFITSVQIILDTNSLLQFKLFSLRAMPPLTIQVRLDVSELMHSGATKVDKFFRHPAPSPRRCSISTLKRTVVFRHIC
jgi:hypothetical protein